MAKLERQFTLGEKEYERLFGPSFLSGFEKGLLAKAKRDLCNSSMLKPDVPKKLIQKMKKGSAKLSVVTTHLCAVFRKKK